MKADIVQDPFDPWQLLARYEKETLDATGKFGAACVFVGTMRDMNEGAAVDNMVLEHYPGMTERQLRRICEEAIARWNLIDALVIHRVGRILPGDPIVLVAVWSVHRGDAYQANRYIMEFLKSQAPFWKKEELPSGARWVERNTPG